MTKSLTNQLKIFCAFVTGAVIEDRAMLPTKNYQECFKGVRVEYPADLGSKRRSMLEKQGANLTFSCRNQTRDAFYELYLFNINASREEKSDS